MEGDSFDRATLFGQVADTRVRMAYADFVRTYQLDDTPAVRRAYDDAVPGRYAEAAAYAKQLKYEQLLSTHQLPHTLAVRAAFKDATNDADAIASMRRAAAKLRPMPNVPPPTGSGMPVYDDPHVDDGQLD